MKKVLIACIIDIDAYEIGNEAGDGVGDVEAETVRGGHVRSRASCTIFATARGSISPFLGPSFHVGLHCTVHLLEGSLKSLTTWGKDLVGG